MITADIEDFRQGKGPFAAKGEKYFREYWASFGATEGTKFYRSLGTFEAWKKSRKN